MINWLISLIKAPPVLSPSGRSKIKKLLLMTGITPEQQQELFDLGLHMNEDNAVRGKALTDEYERRGAKFIYILDNGKLKRNPELDSDKTGEPPQLEDYEDYETYEKAKQRHDYHNPD